jgi:hypothetical protein
MKWLNKAWQWLKRTVMRLAESVFADRGDEELQRRAAEVRELREFGEFSETVFYSKWKAAKQKELGELNRIGFEDPIQATLIQGRRNALQADLDMLESYEARLAMLKNTE